MAFVVAIGNGGRHERQEPQLPGIGIAPPIAIAGHQLGQESRGVAVQAAGNRDRNPGVGEFQVRQLDQGIEFFATFDRAQRAGQLEPHERMRKIDQLDGRVPQLRIGGQPRRDHAHGILPHVALGIFHGPQQRAVVQLAQPVERGQRAGLGLRHARLLHDRAQGAAANGSRRSTNTRWAVSRNQEFGEPTCLATSGVLCSLMCGAGRGGQVSSRRLTFQIRPWPAPLAPVDASSKFLGHEGRMLDPAAIKIDDVQRAVRAGGHEDRMKPGIGRGQKLAVVLAAARDERRPLGEQQPPMHQVRQRLADKRAAGIFACPARRRERSSARTARCNSRSARD